MLGRTCNYGSVSTAKPPWNQNVFVTLCRIVLLWQHWLGTSLSGTNAREPTECWYTGLVLSRLGPAPCDLWPMRGPMTSEVDLHPSLVYSLSTRLLMGDRPKSHSFMPSEKGGKEKQLTKKK